MCKDLLAENKIIAANMCGIPDQESDPEVTRRPTGTRRRQLEWLTNFVLVVVSLFGVSVGSGLLAFYKLHLLSFISIEFMLVPVVLLAGGGFTLLVSVVGLIATSKRSPCLLVFYAILLLLALLVLLSGVACSVRVIFIMFHGIDHYTRPALELAEKYGTDSQATGTWDSLQWSYRCCGAEINSDLGYTLWERNDFLQKDFSVPQSCCIVRDDPNCGKNIFRRHDKESLAENAEKIYIHGCIEAMDYTLKDHVVPILTVFSVAGSLLAMLELLGVVLACCLAYVLTEENRQKKMERTLADRMSLNKMTYNDTSL